MRLCIRAGALSRLGRGSSYASYMEASSPRRTKIIATLGPVTSSKEAVFRLAEAGMDGARLNFSHGTHDEHAEAARHVREVQEELERPLSLIADLQGPKLRVGELDGPVTLAGGDEIIVAGEDACRNGELPVSPSVIGEVL
jgi:pyruvate kinase